MTEEASKLSELLVDLPQEYRKGTYSVHSDKHVFNMKALFLHFYTLNSYKVSSRKTCGKS